MTVRELIEMLEQVDRDWEVRIIYDLDDEEIPVPVEEGLMIYFKDKIVGLRKNLEG